MIGSIKVVSIERTSGKMIICLRTLLLHQATNIDTVSLSPRVVALLINSPSVILAVHYMLDCEFSLTLQFCQECQILGTVFGNLVLLLVGSSGFPNMKKI
jgi:hypothetical protein